MSWLFALVFSIGMLAVPTVAAGATTVTIRITDRLEPANVSIAPGATIRWVNDSGNRHRMRSQRGPGEFDSGNLEPGESFSVRLTAPGTYAYLDERADDDPGYFGRIVVATTLTGSKPDSSSGTPSGGTSTPPTATPWTAIVGMAGRAFGPSSMTIAQGGSVTWTNDDDREHTVTATSGTFDSGVLGAGSTWEATFPTVGTFAYLCAIHPEMTGRVVVQADDSSEGDAPEGTAAAPAPDPAPTPTPRPASTPETGSSVTAAPVEVRDFEYAPKAMTVSVGSQVTWTNAGDAPHTIRAADNSFDSGNVAAGQTFTHTFTSTGEFPFVCSFHPQMTGEIQVTETVSPPAPDRTGGTGVGAEAGSPDAGSNEAGPGSGGEQTLASRSDIAGTAVRPTTTSDNAGMVRLGLVVVIVAAAAGLFVRTIRGAVRPTH